jgi:hypothetical protein
MAEDETIAYDFVSELLATGQVSDAAFARVRFTPARGLCT